MRREKKERIRGKFILFGGLGTERGSEMTGEERRGDKRRGKERRGEERRRDETR